MSQIFKYSILLILIISKGYSQDGMYFIASDETNLNNEKVAFNSYLLRYKPDSASLKVISKVCDVNHQVEWVRMYPDYSVLIILKTNKKTNEKSITKISLNNPVKITEKNIGLKEYHLSFTSPFIYNLNKLTLHINLLSKSKSGELEDIEVDIDVSTLEVKSSKANIDSYTHAQYFGNSGIMIWSNDGTAFYSDSTKKKMLLPITVDYSKRPAHKTLISDSIGLEINERYILNINTNEVLAIGLQKSTKQEEYPPYTGVSDKKVRDSIYIANKKTNKSIILKLKGNYSMVRAQGEYIYGTVANMYSEKSKKAVSPGFQVRSKEFRETGIPFDFRSSDNLYYPGILFLVNTKTGMSIEWETGQGDSEILSIDNNIVYYRVNDKIYKRKIENYKLGTPQMLFTDKYVPDIHWMWTTN